MPGPGCRVRTIESTFTFDYEQLTLMMDRSLLCWRVGGAKLAYGLYHHFWATGSRVVVNTGDDFEHFGVDDLPRSGHGHVQPGRDQ